VKPVFAFSYSSFSFLVIGLVSASCMRLMNLAASFPVRTGVAFHGNLIVFSLIVIKIIKIYVARKLKKSYIYSRGKFQ